MKIQETERLGQITRYELGFWEKGILPGGMDEVGRGPLAGPVVAACVILPSSPLIEYVNDSKKLTESRREKLCPLILQQAVGCGVGWVDENTIDEINILNATKLAFQRAYEGMENRPEHVLVDAVAGLRIAARQHPLVHGDALSYLIAAASIVAKVQRDQYMIQMHNLYPQYGFDRNKGYGTAEHIRALTTYGPCPIHRKTFIKNFVRTENEQYRPGETWRESGDCVL